MCQITWAQPQGVQWASNWPACLTACSARKGPSVRGLVWAARHQVQPNKQSPARLIFGPIFGLISQQCFRSKDQFILFSPKACVLTSAQDPIGENTWPPLLSILSYPLMKKLPSYTLDQRAKHEPIRPVSLRPKVLHCMLLIKRKLFTRALPYCMLLIKESYLHTQTRQSTALPVFACVNA